MTSKNPYVFLDVDGVLNAFGIEDQPHQHRKLVVDTGEFHLYIRDAVLDWLRRLCRVADVRWASTWQDHANEVLAPAFGLDVLPVACRDVDQHGISKTDGPWKADGVVQTVEADPRPFVWIDDDAITPRAQRRVARLQIPHLCVRPRHTVGITDDQMAEVDEFLAGLP